MSKTRRLLATYKQNEIRNYAIRQRILSRMKRFSEGHPVLINDRAAMLIPADPEEMEQAENVMENHSELCRTLYYYLLLERNLVKTSQALFIHRNTLGYRIRQIRDICSFDLNDPYKSTGTVLSDFFFVKIPSALQ